MNPTGVTVSAVTNTSGSRLPSITSSEYYSRVEALELQLQEERKRRKMVEKTIDMMRVGGNTARATDRPPSGQPRAPSGASADGTFPVNPQSVLTELSLFLLQKEKPTAQGCSARGPAASCESARSSQRAAPSQRSGSSKTKHPSVPRPPSRDRQRSAPRQSGGGRDEVWSAPKQIKPPLPAQAKGNHTCEATPNRFAKKKTNPVDVYMSSQRHDKRMQALNDFCLAPI